MASGYRTIRAPNRRTLADRSRLSSSLARHDQRSLPLRAGKYAAIGYARVSSREAARDGLSLTVQARRIRDYAEAHGIKLVEVVADPGVSAGKPIAKRPGGKRLVKEGWEPMGEKWWTGTLCKIARRG